MDTSVEILKKVLDACSMRHSVLANNIANANTPGFRRCDVPFRQALSKAIETRSHDAVLNFQPKAVEDASATVRNDGNSVSLQTEMGALTENNLMYGMAIRAVSGKFSTLRKAIKGG